MVDLESVFLKNELDKLGNAIVFMCERMGQISKTKLLKLIYLIEESSIKKYGAPFFNLRFDVWKFGPVSPTLYVELSNGPDMLSDYIDRIDKNDMVLIRSKKDFSDDEFNDQEMDLMEQIVEEFKPYSADQLINLTHRPDSPWHLAAQEHGCLELFNAHVASISNVQIDFSRMLAGDTVKQATYNKHVEFLRESKSLKL